MEWQIERQECRAQRGPECNSQITRSHHHSTNLKLVTVQCILSKCRRQNIQIHEMKHGLKRWRFNVRKGQRVGVVALDDFAENLRSARNEAFVCSECGVGRPQHKLNIRVEATVKKLCHVVDQSTSWNNRKLVPESVLMWKNNQNITMKANLCISLDLTLFENSTVPPKTYIAPSMTHAE